MLPRPSTGASLVCVVTVALMLGVLLPAAHPGPRLEFTRLVAHWADYADPGYLPFIEEAQPEVVQVGFYGAHFWSLADTSFGGGYPAHFPRRGHRECAAWFQRLNDDLHRRGAKVVGHFNMTFLVGDPDGPDGPRGFFKFYRDQWDEEQLGPKPVDDPLEFLERNRQGQPLKDNNYAIGGMAEHWACLNNPHWRQVLKAWVRFAIAQGVDGLVANYFYRHDCHCEHCVPAFRHYLRQRFTPAQMSERFAITNLDTHRFEELGAWHDPAQSTPLRRESLRFSQIATKEAFDEVFVNFGRSLKPDLIIAQWNHLGDFAQISGDERCLLPDDRWGRDEDYLWYSTGGVTNPTDLTNGVLGEATLQMRYIRGAFEDKPFTLGRYEGVRLRSAMAELAANGGAPMGFYTPFKDLESRREIVRYYQFLGRYDPLYRANHSHGEVLLLFPRTRVHDGDLAALTRFKEAGRRLLDAHVLFDVAPDDHDFERARYATVLDPALANNLPASLTPLLPLNRSRFDAPAAVRVSASRPATGSELTVHCVNYNREEPADPKQSLHGIEHEKPIPTVPFTADILLPPGTRAERVEWLTPEAEEPREVEFKDPGDRLHVIVPAFLVYGVLRIRLSDGSPPPARRVAALVTEYRHNSHADIIVSRLLLTDTLDGKGAESPLRLASLYTDQRPENDMSRLLAASHRFRLSPTVSDALTLGTGSLAVDGVLLVAEHGDYPRSDSGNIQYPKRRLWESVLQVFRDSGRVVPVFVDKHLADNWADAKFLHDTAAELKIPLMAGSSLPTTWRRPVADVPRDAPLRDIVAITFHTTDAYGFHALEFAQALAEQRRGGETGIRSVQSLAGEAVWRALDEPAFDTELFEAAWNRLSRPLVGRDALRGAVREPRLFRIDYKDGLRTHLLELNGAAGEWTAAWRTEDGRMESSLFWTQEGRPGMHFTWLLHGIEEMMLTGKPAWNVERTLLTSGALDALLISLKEDQRRVDTPYLNIHYQPAWRWTEPPPPPPMRPWAEQ